MQAPPPVSKGRWRFLIGTTLLGVGLVLTGLGFDSHTTEALPFGVVTLAIGVGVSWKPWRALRAARRDASPGVEVEVVGESSSPPSSVKCGHCGSASPIRLESPSVSTCEHCGHRNALPAELAKRVAAAAVWVKAHERAERQIAEVVASLPEREAALSSRLRAITLTLTLVAVGLVAYGVSRRHGDQAWHAFVCFGVLGGLTALVLGTRARAAVPSLVTGVVGHWTALRLEGGKGLSCRVCGGPLPGVASAVLRCEFCGSDNLAGPAVLARVAARAIHAVLSVGGVEGRSREADEQAAYSIVSLPVFVLLAWFGIGAFAGGVGLRALGDVTFAVDESVPYVVVDGCIGVVEEDGEVRFSATEKRKVSPLPPTVPITSFIGKRLSGKGKLLRVWRTVEFFDRNEGAFLYEYLQQEGTVTFPSRTGYGEALCLESG